MLFRDFLRAHPVKAGEYETEKRRFAVEEKLPRAEYTDAKNGIISLLSEQAEGWKTAPKSVLAILGSAKGGANTKQFLREEFPRAEIVDLAKTPVSPYEYSAEAEDNFAETVSKMIAADLVVIATPVYWYGMSGAAKDFFDRFSNLLRGPHKPLGEALYGKKIQLLSTGYDQRLPYGFEVPFASTAIYMGMDYLGAKYRSVQ